MALPPSLGDLKPTFVKVQETHDLPGTRKELVSKVVSLIEGGGVHKLTVEYGRPIRVDRYVAASDGPKEEPEVPDNDIMSAIRNGEVIEYPITTGNPFFDLFKLFAILTKKNLRASLVLVHHLDELDTWLGLEKLTHLEELFGVEVRQSPGVENNSLLLVASDINDPSVVAATIRVFMEKANEANRGEGPKERNRGKGNGRAPGAMGKPS